MEDAQLETPTAQAREEAQQGGLATVSIRHAGPIGQKTLARLREEGGVKVGWAEYRMGVLGWLEGKGVGGVGELMVVTMKGVMKGGEGKG